MIPLESILAGSSKVKYILYHMTWHVVSKYHSWVFSQRNENIPARQDLHTNVLRSFIHNRQKLEAFTCPPTGEWIDKLWSIHSRES